MYISEFHQAIESSNKILQSNIWFQPIQTKYNTPENMEILSKEISNYLSHLSYESLVANCSPFHYFIKNKIENIFNCKAYLTIGYVNLGDRFFYKIGLEDVQDAIRSKYLPSSHHAWLTLDNYEVFDMTFATSLGIIQQKQELIGQIIHQHPKDFTGSMAYHPVLVGAEFFRECNFDIKSISNLMFGQY